MRVCSDPADESKGDTGCAHRKNCYNQRIKGGKDDTHFNIARLCGRASCLRGCGAKRETLRLGMNEAQVKQCLGDPADMRGAMINKYGQQIAVWE